MNNVFSNKIPLLFFLSFVHVTLSIDCEFAVEMKQNLRGDGYHRNLTYSLQFLKGGTEGAGSCYVSVEQPLPAGLYVNNDQLMELNRAEQVIAKAFQRIDVELSAEQATPATVSMLGSVDERVQFWVPVHARYHQAVKGGGFAVVDIPPPKLFISCKEDLLAQCKRVLSDRSGHCLPSAKCDWMAIPFSMITATPRWSVPVGNTEDWLLVAVGTSVAYFICTVAILKSLHDFKVRTKIPPHWNLDENAKDQSKKCR